MPKFAIYIINRIFLHKVKIIILSVLGVLLVGSSVAYAYSQKGTLISQKTEELPDGNIYVEELYEIDQ